MTAMGMDLSGAGGYFRGTATGWSRLLELAQQHGWQPTHTGPPRGTLKADWSGTDHSNDGQRFYARDARRLAAALEQALNATPTQKLKKDQSTWLFTPEGKDAIREFITFCRAGSFRMD